MPSREALATVRPPRTRTRAIEVTPENMTTSQREDALKVQMRIWYDANRTMNDMKKVADKAKAEVESLMNGLGKTTAESFYKEKGLTVEAHFYDSEKDVIDIEKLFEEVPRKTFFEIVTATKKAVSDVMGANMVNAVVKTVKAGVAFKIGVKK